MVLPVYIPSLIRRHMKLAPAFSDARDGGSPPRAIDVKDESVVGWYVNPLPDDSEWLLFTERALYVVRAHEVQRFAFDGIVSYERPASKTDADSVVIATRAGNATIPMRGRNGSDGRFCDAWLFVRIVHALV